MSTITYDKEHFYIDGNPIKIVSGAMHYFRIVPEYWHDRLLKLKECGCNCIETYICWNLHEKTEGVLNFEGWLDFGKYIDMANEMGLYVIVRPGPYICSEWDMGGLPWWLLKYHDIELRCSNERFKSLAAPYLERVCDIMRPRLITNGGNIIFVQIENEYGSYGDDKEYLNWLKSFYESRNIDCGFLTSDGHTDRMLTNGTVEGVLATVNYRNETEECISALKKFRPDQPGAVMELWNGRAMTWSTKFERRDVCEVKESVRSSLEYAELVNMYMFHGGTNFGFMNGAWDHGGKFLPMMTSYDVDAPLDEYGRRTPKYYAEQEVICAALGKKAENTATDTVIISYDNLTKVGECSLKESGLTLKTNRSETPRSMEFYDQGYGYIIYESNVFVDDAGADLMLPVIHDVAHVYIDGEYKASFTRYSEKKSVTISQSGNHRISIFVENLGRVNCRTKLKDRKGLIGNVTFRDRGYGMESIVHGFTVYSLPLEDLPRTYCGKATVDQPAFYKYEFTADTACDTVLHLKGFTRGVAFINGFNLGRHWDIENSENKLFIPAPLINCGTNEIIIFDVLHKNTKKQTALGEFCELGE